MSFEKLRDVSLDYQLCRYPGSKLLFRGPRRKLKGPYMAFLGGTETYGKFIETPYPALLEARTGVKCVNFGWPNAGVDVYLQEDAVLEATAAADVTILQVPCAQNMSNRFYSVHPRRNDRFVGASSLMQQVFEDIDFTQFNFTRHLLGHLQKVSPRRFGIIREELQDAWVIMMRRLLDQIGGQTVLLWFSARGLDDKVTGPEAALDPAFVSRKMIDNLAGKATKVVEVTASPVAQAAGTKGMVFSQLERAAANALLNPAAHEEAADALEPVLAHLMGE